MPFGVSHDFLTLLDEGKRRGLVALLPLAVAGLAGGVVAELLDPGRAGAFLQLYGGALAAGVVAGGVAGWRVVRAWGESLRESWTDWMHSAVGAATVADAAERAGAPHVTVGRLAGAALLAANGAVLVAAWFRLPPFGFAEPYSALALVTVACTGLAVGARASIEVAQAIWCREIEQQTLDLVEEGRVGVWGMR